MLAEARRRSDRVGQPRQRGAGKPEGATAERHVDEEAAGGELGVGDELGGREDGNASSPAAWSRAASSCVSCRTSEADASIASSRVVVPRIGGRRGPDEPGEVGQRRQAFDVRPVGRAGAPATRRRPRTGTRPAARRTGSGSRGVRAVAAVDASSSSSPLSATYASSCETSNHPPTPRSSRSRSPRSAAEGTDQSAHAVGQRVARAAAARRRRTRCAPRSTTPPRWSARTTAGPTTGPCSRTPRAIRTRAPGCAAHRSAAPSPKPSITPGRKFSTSTSASADEPAREVAALDRSAGRARRSPCCGSS